jgi:hypothetical protein
MTNGGQCAHGELRAVTRRRQSAATPLTGSCEVPPNPFALKAKQAKGCTEPLTLTVEGHVIRMDQTGAANKCFESKPESRRQVGRSTLRRLEDIERMIYDS